MAGRAGAGKVSRAVEWQMKTAPVDCGEQRRMGQRRCIEMNQPPVKIFTGQCPHKRGADSRATSCARGRNRCAVQNGAWGDDTCGGVLNFEPL